MNASRATEAQVNQITTAGGVPKIRTHIYGVLIISLLLAFVALVPSMGALPNLSLYDSKRGLQIGLLLLNGIWILTSLARRNGPMATYSLLPSWGRRLMAGVLFLGCVSAAASAMPFYGFLELFHLLLLGALALSVAHLYVNKVFVSDSALLGAILLGVVLYEVSFVVGYGLSLASPNIKLWPTGYTGFEHVRFFNQFQTWTLPLIAIVPLLFSEEAGWRRSLLLIPAAVWWMLLFASGGRGTLLGTLVAGIVVFVFFGRRSLPLLKLQGLAGAAGACAYGLLFKIFATTNASLLDRVSTTDMGRIYYWRRALEMIEKNWLLGIGPMHHASLTKEYWSHPHNTMVQVALEWGLAAAGLLVLATMWAFWSWVRQSRRRTLDASGQNEVHVRVGLTGTLTAAGVHAFFSGIAVMPMSQTVGALILGWILGIFIVGRTKEKPLIAFPPRGYRYRLLAASYLLGIGIVAWGTIPEIQRREESEQEYIRTVDPHHFHPRFWRQGAIRY